MPVELSESNHPVIIEPGQIMVTVLLDQKRKSIEITGPQDPLLRLKVLSEAVKTLIDQTIQVRNTLRMKNRGG